MNGGLTAVQGPGGTVTFTYDGDGLRFSKTTVTGTTYYVRNPQGEVTEEWSGTPSLLAEYVYLDGQRVCKITHDAQDVEHRVYYHADMLGTPVAETNESGQVLVRSEYYPFGDEVKPGTAGDPHKFTGKELDDEFGLYYFGARYYDAHLGRFVSVDPEGGYFEDPESWNRYAYGLNNPLRYVDRDGAAAEEVMPLAEAAPIVVPALGAAAPAAAAVLAGAGIIVLVTSHAEPLSDAQVEQIHGANCHATNSQLSEWKESRAQNGTAERKPREGAGRNEQHGRSQDKPSQEKQLRDLEKQLKNASGRREKTQLRNKMKNIQKDMDRQRTGTQHSQNAKGVGQS